MAFRHTSFSYPSTMAPKPTGLFSPTKPGPTNTFSPIKPGPTDFSPRSSEPTALFSPRTSGPADSFIIDSPATIGLTSQIQSEPTGLLSQISPEFVGLLSEIELEPIDLLSPIPPIQNFQDDAEDDRLLHISSDIDMQDGCPPKKRLKTQQISEGHFLESELPVPLDDTPSSSSSSSVETQQCKKWRLTKLSSRAKRRQKEKRNERKPDTINACFELRRKSSVKRSLPGEKNMVGMTMFDRKMASTNHRRKSNVNLVAPFTLELSGRNTVNQFFGNPNVFCFPLESSNFPFPPILRLTTMPEKPVAEFVDRNVSQFTGTSKSARSAKPSRRASAATSSSSLKVIFNGKTSSKLTSACSSPTDSDTDAPTILRPIMPRLEREMLPRPAEDLGGLTNVEASGITIIPSSSNIPKLKKSAQKTGNNIQWLPDMTSNSNVRSKRGVKDDTTKKSGLKIESQGQEISEVMEVTKIETKTELTAKKSDPKVDSTKKKSEPTIIEPTEVAEKEAESTIEIEQPITIETYQADVETKLDTDDHKPGDLAKKESSVSKFGEWLVKLTSKISIPRIMSRELNEADSVLIIDPPSGFLGNQRAFRHKFLGRSDSLKEFFGMEEFYSLSMRKIKSWTPGRRSSRVSPMDWQNNNFKGSCDLSSAEDLVNSDESLDSVAPRLRLPVQMLDGSAVALGLELKTEGYNNSISCEFLYDRNNLSTTFSVTPAPSMAKSIWSHVKSGLSRRPGEIEDIPPPLTPEAITVETPMPDSPAGPGFLKKIFSKDASWVQTIRGNWSKFKSWVLPRRRQRSLVVRVPRRKRRRYLLDRSNFMDHHIIPGTRKRNAIPRYMYFDPSRNRQPLRMMANQETPSLEHIRSDIVVIEHKAFSRKSYSKGFVSNPAIRRKSSQLRASSILTRKVHIRRH